MSIVLQRGVTYWYRSKCAQAAAEWGEVHRDLRHARNCFAACLDLLGEGEVARLAGDPDAPRTTLDVEDSRYTTFRSLCDSGLISYERAFEFDTNGRLAHLDRAAVAADPDLGDGHDALRLARNKLVAHPASGLEGSDCEVELTGAGALRIDLRTRNTVIPIDLAVLQVAPAHIDALTARFLRPHIDHATEQVDLELQSRASLAPGGLSVQIATDTAHQLIAAHNNHTMVNTAANPKRRNAASRNYPPAPPSNG